MGYKVKLQKVSRPTNIPFWGVYLTKVGNL